ncbi:MAG TPA: protein YgfX [Gallionella sp.]|nr:protein YgfX [Gallionella sp.]
MPGAPVLEFPVKPSPRFAALLLLFHLVAALVVSATAMSLPAKLLLILVVAISLTYYLLRDVLLLLPGSWHEIFFDQHDVSIVARNGSGFLGQIANQTVVNPYFVVLCVKSQTRHKLVCRVIFPDSISPGAFRELCVHLKFA